MEAVAPSPELTLSPPPIESAALVPSRAPLIPAAKDKRQGESVLVHMALLLGITVLGGVLRFICLDRPPIWGDEAATFGRASGTFAELMSRLQSAGFAPVHYELVWWIGQHFLLTPFMMRLVPAIAGTLTIPAMYWLAAQLIGRRAALFTALLTATSAFLLNYSRDAKMYSPFWLFLALNVASLIWWLRVRTPLSWCAWIASGTAMVGFDALGWITVAIELLIVLTAREANWLSLLRLALLLICSSAIWCLTIGVPTFALLMRAHALDDRFRHIAIAVFSIAGARLLWLTAMFWINRPKAVDSHLPSDTAGADAEHAQQIPPVEDAEHPPQSNSIKNTLSRLGSYIAWPTERSFVRPWVVRRMVAFRWPPLVLFIFGVLIMFAGPFGYYYDFNRFLEKVDARGWHGTGIDWVEGYDAGRDGPSLVGFTASAFLTSWEWPRAVDEREILPRTLRLLTVGTLSIAAVLALGLLPWPWARPLRPSHGVAGWRSALWLTLWLTVPPYAFYCVSVRDHVGPVVYHELPKNIHLPALLGGHITTSLSRAVFGPTPAIIVKQIILAVWSFGISLADTVKTDLAWLQEPRWAEGLLGLTALLWFWTCASCWSRRLVRAMQFVGIALTALLLIEAVYLVYPQIDTALSAHSEAWREHGSVWMPRYIAVVLPAFLIIASALLFRLPTRPLRWTAALLFVIVNVSINGARLFAGTEQPTPLLAHDIVASQTADNGDHSVTAFFQPSMQAFGAAPGTIGLHNAATRYYITILSPRSQPINEVLADQMHYRIRPGHGTWMSFTGFVINEVRRSPNLKSFITWERLEPREIDLTDKPLDALAPGWKLASESSYTVRDHWRWTDTCVLRRRVYVRTASSQ